MSECKHKVTGAADWQGECPYCKLEQLEMDHVFYRLAIKERDYERERNARLEAERDALKADVENLTEENQRLRSEQSMLYMDYRMKCDEETKAQAVMITKLIAERDALKDALLMIRLDYSAPGSELEADIDAVIDAARGE